MHISLENQSPGDTDSFYHAVLLAKCLKEAVSTQLRGKHDVNKTQEQYPRLQMSMSQTQSHEYVRLALSLLSTL